MDQAFSLIIPAYNEETAIRDVVCQAEMILGAMSRRLEIIIVNDGSTDRTGVVLKSLEHEFQNVIVLNHENNRGYGAALKTGFSKSSNEIVVITDADGSYRTESIAELVKAMDDADMAVGARVGKSSRSSFFRRPAKWALRKLASYLSGSPIPDLNSGLRAMKLGIVNRFVKILPDGFSFTTTITLAMLTNNYSVKFIPIAYGQRKGKSKIRPLHDTLSFIQMIMRTVMYFNPLRVFIPLSLFFFLSAIVVLVLTAVFAERIMDVTVELLIVTGMQTLLIGMLADLIDKRSAGR